jgi:hypothetical protein
MSRERERQRERERETERERDRDRERERERGRERQRERETEIERERERERETERERQRESIPHLDKLVHLLRKFVVEVLREILWPCSFCSFWKTHKNCVKWVFEQACEIVCMDAHTVGQLQQGVFGQIHDILQRGALDPVRMPDKAQVHAFFRNARL